MNFKLSFLCSKRDILLRKYLNVDFPSVVWSAELYLYCKWFMFTLTFRFVDFITEYINGSVSKKKKKKRPIKGMHKIYWNR